MMSTGLKIFCTLGHKVEAISVQKISKENYHICRMDLGCTAWIWATQQMRHYKIEYLASYTELSRSSIES